MLRFRRFWFLLALLLPLQLSWSVASAYCAHESNPGHATHIGHHEHVHKAELKNTTASQAAFDADCGSCHASCVPLLLSPAHSLPAADFTHLHMPPPQHPYLSAQPRAPDRPQWPRLA
ncbi:cobalt-zinc-cadmium resistance protein [Variovorax sp. WS11]|uniref:cation efflux protein, CzcI family n=1 Tax=Variovorax sp. WS11 TaxID=1105204 RepID=UPI000D0D5BE6|nr:cation efflux protein, CzcI family [Variovorax sp. WS11]PSL86512.1 cobalt-zinc-cadmium resistance protein [Variovorax sp. WS11]